MKGEEGEGDHELAVRCHKKDATQEKQVKERGSIVDTCLPPALLIPCKEKTNGNEGGCRSFWDFVIPAGNKVGKYKKGVRKEPQIPSS